ncbi:hypothetical protein [Streptomyces sp. APSN-46.1]|uniref:hypothetical protein n=1 Tax=Streptomyces sp. APSN-46.1 TaxID=2929049 RepID=UPI001FB548A8|nr:hypothetical protein [Streptomyces sp. APSN-46.1]
MPTPDSTTSGAGRVGDPPPGGVVTTEYESVAVGLCLCFCGTTTCRGGTRGFKYRTDSPRYAAAYLRGSR